MSRDHSDRRRSSCDHSETLRRHAEFYELARDGETVTLAGRNVVCRGLVDTVTTNPGQSRDYLHITIKVALPR